MPSLMGATVGGYDIVHVRDPLDRDFSTRLSNVFVIGQHGKPAISLVKGGIRLTITEERDQRRKAKESQAGR